MKKYELMMDDTQYFLRKLQDIELLNCDDDSEKDNSQ